MTMMIKQKINEDGVQLKDCFLCCAAMLADMSYDLAVTRIGSLYNVFTTRGVFGDECAYILEHLKLGKKNEDYKLLFMMPEYATTGFLRNILWGRRTLLQVRSKNFAGEMHIVYWDGQELFDPSNFNTYKWEEVEPIYVWIFNEALGRL